VSSGRGGNGGYFGTGPSPTTFEFAFAGGISSFGFYGAEALVSDFSNGRNAILDLEVYDISSNLLGAFSYNTVTSGFNWADFYGFKSDTDVIGSVIFRNAGHMVLDDVQFISADIAQVPEPSTLAIFALGIMGLASRRLNKQ